VEFHSTSVPLRHQRETLIGRQSALLQLLKFHDKSLQRCRKDSKKKWKFIKGWLLKNFNQTQQVKEGSRADNAGLKLGDSIVTINDKDTSSMTLQEANNVLEQAAQQNVKLGVIKWVDILLLFS
jgi:S1-C subfamily serine protease